MNVFYEFQKIVRHLQAEKIEYALIGGVALAFYAEPRFTKDIDLLVREGELGACPNNRISLDNRK
ncbi:MAG: nucleotidyl transferase AbiEii/AbiGii toxin family protein [bacterium]|nr:nucleotidyl transferase AbiEii/AbiGii toxin family protein [bacterium]